MKGAQERANRLRLPCAQALSLLSDVGWGLGAAGAYPAGRPWGGVLVSHADWWSGFLVFEGRAELVHSGNSDPETLRLARRHIFSATTRRRSADWAQYDRIAAADQRVAMVVRPAHVYGSALAKLREAVAK